MESVLCVHDASPWSNILIQAFADEFSVTHVRTPEAALQLMAYRQFDAVLVDAATEDALELPKLSACLKSTGVYVYLSGAAQTDEIIRVFSADYDEYLSLPLEPIVVRLRLAARLKNRARISSGDCLTRGSLRIVIAQQRVVETTDDGGERDLELTPNEFRILYALVIRERQTLSRDQILKDAWGESLHVEVRTVDKHICSLRRKLGRHSKALVSVAGKGYLFDSYLVSHSATDLGLQRVHASVEV